MPRNSSGVYSQPPGTAAVAGQVASSSAFNDLVDDIGDEITASLPVNGDKAMDAPLSLAVGSASLPGVVFDGDPNSGFYHIGGDSIGLSLGGTLRVTYATSGVTYAVPVNFAAAVTVADSGTPDIGAAASNTIIADGTTTITSFGTAAAGVERWVRFSGARTLTHNGTSLILPGAANITTAAGDVAHFKSEGSGNWRCYAYHRAATLPLAYATQAQTAARTNNTTAVTPFSAALAPGHIFGCTLSNNGSDATNDIDIAAGSVRDSTDAINIIGTAQTKRLDAGWAAGTGNGFRNSAAAITDTTYHIYLVSKALGADPDYYAHTSATVSTVLTALQAETGGADYIYARRIGSIIRASSAIVAFTQDGDIFYRAALSEYTASTARSIATLTLAGVPTGITVRPLMDCFIQSGGAGADAIMSMAPGANQNLTVKVCASDGNASTRLLSSFTAPLTDTSARIYMAVTIGSGSLSSTDLRTAGWIDTRGRLS